MNKSADMLWNGSENSNGITWCVRHKPLQHHFLRVNYCLRLICKESWWDRVKFLLPNTYERTTIWMLLSISYPLLYAESDKGNCKSWFLKQILSARQTRQQSNFSVKLYVSVANSTWLNFRDNMHFHHKNSPGLHRTKLLIAKCERIWLNEVASTSS